ncbi:MAG: Uma2 family endonuclease [Oscillospiraceae bacterium]|nr:Uma2 family endonuclease [Oscillospiraceae bacterium]
METVQKEKRYTYAQYRNWPDDERWELIDGFAYSLAAPSLAHQRVCGEIFRQIGNFLRDKPCQVFNAPCDVRLSAEGNDDDVVQPDILVVCDEKKLEDGKSVVDAPALVVEVLSPATTNYDRIKKYRLYQRAGIKEYWIVDPDEKVLTVNILRGERYAGFLYFEDDGNIPVEVLPGCAINLAEVFKRL